MAVFSPLFKIKGSYIHSVKWKIEYYCSNKGITFIKNRSAYFCPQIPYTIKLKIREIVAIVRILKAIGQIFSSTEHGVADRRKHYG